MTGLQNQLAELQRSAEDTYREVRRLNELLAEQNASTKKALTDQRVQEEAIAAALKDISDRLAEVNERYQALKATLPPASDPGAGGSGQAAMSTPGTTPSTVAPGAPPAPPPAPPEPDTQAYAHLGPGNYDLPNARLTR